MKNIAKLLFLLGGILTILIMSVVWHNGSDEAKLAKEYSNMVYGNGDVLIIDSNKDDVTFRYYDEDSSRLVTVNKEYAESIINRGE